MADLTRTRPAFEKLAIGPVMVLGEMITGGHYLEVLRIGKQVVVGRQAAPSYWKLHTTYVGQSGFVGAFYRGFMPWGLIQCTKGIPVLFVQHESMYQLQARAGWSKNKAEKTSGFLGGFAQALFVNPLQKLKVSVVACDHLSSLTPMQAFKTIVAENGFLSLYDGVLPMIIRRSIDWGIRFGISNEAKHWVVEQKRANGESPTLNYMELIGCGIIGGVAGSVTHPIDNIITNSQKPLPMGTPRDLRSVIRRMFQESGHHAFTRGWGIEILDNAYHMAWMYGIGTIVYELVDQALNRNEFNIYYRMPIKA